MFAGIIEATEPILKSDFINQTCQIKVHRPVTFSDIALGDSIAVNGVCLTVENFDLKSIQFTLGFETLQVLGEVFKQQWLTNPVNLERSLRFGDRVHGHMVTGHVETMVKVVKSESLGENWLLSIELPKEYQRYCWKKGSVALNGVSLTINKIEAIAGTKSLEVCLIPETQKRTNLPKVKVGDRISYESDSFAKAIVHAIDLQRAESEVPHV